MILEKKKTNYSFFLLLVVEKDTHWVMNRYRGVREYTRDPPWSKRNDDEKRIAVVFVWKRHYTQNMLRVIRTRGTHRQVEQVHVNEWHASTVDRTGGKLRRRNEERRDRWLGIFQFRAIDWLIDVWWRMHHILLLLLPFFSSALIKWQIDFLITFFLFLLLLLFYSFR